MSINVAHHFFQATLFRRQGEEFNSIKITDAAAYLRQAHRVPKDLQTAIVYELICVGLAVKIGRNQIQVKKPKDNLDMSKVYRQLNCWH